MDDRSSQRPFKVLNQMRVKNFALRHYVGRCHIKGQTGREDHIKGLISHHVLIAVF